LGITQVGTSKYRETVTSDGRGHEIEITGRLAPGWSLSLNYARPDIVFTDLAPSMKGFLAETKSAWDGSANPLDTTPATVATFVRTRDSTPGRDFVLNPATFNDAYDYVQSLVEIVNSGTGKPPLSFIGESFNAFTSFRFPEGAFLPLRQARVGFGANYRGPSVIGFHAADNNAPIFGRSSIIYNLMIGKQVRIRRGQSFDFQLNIENLFHQEDLLPFSAATPGSVVRFMLPRVRHGWTVRATYTF
jgi:hypothetical protein